VGLINVSLNGRPYDIACDDGQEEHVALLAEMLNERVTALAETVGQVGESRLLLMAGLLVADELIDARTELEQLISVEGPISDGSGPVVGSMHTANGLTEAELVEMINGLAQRIEDIADHLKST